MEKVIVEPCQTPMSLSAAMACWSLIGMTHSAQGQLGRSV
jgi:hypothetical protein